MKGFKIIGIVFLIVINSKVQAQVGFGLRGSLHQSAPLVLRDSFSGTPALGAGINIYFNARTKIKFAAGLSYKSIAVNHKIEPYSLNWKVIGCNIGAEWKHSKMSNTRFYTGTTVNSIFAMGKTNLSSNSNSGQGYSSINVFQSIVPSIELGLIFNPHPLVTLNVSTLQPIPQSTYQNKPTLPGMISIGIEYRITTKDMKNWDMDTSILPERIFAENLKRGTLYVIEEGKEASIMLFRKKMMTNYTFSKVSFIKASELTNLLNSLKHSADSNQCFFLKSGRIIYNIESPSTLGVIIYNFKMQNPIPDTPFYVRDLSGNSDFDDPIILKKVVSKLNKRLNKL